MTLLNLLLTAYIGLVLGGFVTVLVPRLGRARPETIRAALKTISLPPSSCSCGRHLTAIEKAPVIGWIFSRGACGSCGIRIPAVYPAIELAAGALLLLMTVGALALQPGVFALQALIPGSLVVLAIALLSVAPTAAYAVGTIASLWLTTATLDPRYAATGGILLLSTLLWRQAGGQVNSPVRVLVGISLALIALAIPGHPALTPLAVGVATILSFRLPSLFPAEPKAA